ncbi:MAG: Asp-tRNA(Asn)/Glu-tRNA(Gln) amidotransferase subunit GatC [Candidatus Omnitrophica bacterium]|nr:Asp-tRNA(Asn)/Glu-tRNA(Gln) amidotransferase subunit GatC [Candidatus Omnitrophota bacterium]
MGIDKETVKYVANLARIELRDEELKRLSEQLKQIIDFIDKLKLLDIKDVEPTSHILPMSNVLRDDQPRESLPISKTLECAPAKEENFFLVPKVIE